MTQPAAIEPHADLFAHDADIGVRGIGPTRESAFEQAALALSMAVTDLADPTHRRVPRPPPWPIPMSAAAR